VAASPDRGAAGSKAEPRLDVRVGTEIDGLGAIATFVGRTLPERPLE
jgi:hypothetical protein